MLQVAKIVNRVCLPLLAGGAMSILLAGCGQSGPLYLPETQAQPATASQPPPEAQPSEVPQPATEPAAGKR